MAKQDKYAVKQVRGPFVELPPHPDHCESAAELVSFASEKHKQGVILAADLFCGAGGLSEGLRAAGIESVLGVDHYSYAIETHASRFPGMSVDWNLADKAEVERVATLMKDAGIEVLAGGPPCQPFSKAGRSGIRFLVERGERDPIDQRRHLWRAYLEVAQLARPAAVIMENVPDMALDDEMFILRSMVEELEQIGYSVEARVIETRKYGVPQFRQRLILVGLRDGIQFRWPNEVPGKVKVIDAFSDMPSVEGGWRPKGGANGWAQYEGPKTSFQKHLRRNVSVEDQHKLYDHITRPVREDDREAFELMTSETKYSDLPERLQRYRSDIFTDKYKRLDAHNVSRTVTAHIAKDGYGFIHPWEPRTITVREAARLQTFPDDFRFSGPPSAAFKQIGNAVPVRLGEAIGAAVMRSLSTPEKKATYSRDISSALSTWYETRTEKELSQSWLRNGDRWEVLVGEIFVDRLAPTIARFMMSSIQKLGQPKQASPDVSSVAPKILALFPGERFKHRREIFSAVVQQMQQNPEALWERQIDRKKLPSIRPSLAKLLELAAPIHDGSGERSEEPVIIAKGVLRVTTRFHGHDFESQNKQTDGRISVARMLGLNSSSRRAHLALFEIARMNCFPTNPICETCPLVSMCKKFGVEDPSEPSLF